MNTHILSIPFALVTLTSSAWSAILIDPTTLNGSFELPSTSKIAYGFDGAINIPSWGNTGGAYTDTGIETGISSGQDGAQRAFFKNTDGGAFNLTSYVMQAGDSLTLTFSALRFNSGDNFTAKLFSSTDATYATNATLNSLIYAPVSQGTFEGFTLNYTAVAADAGKTIGVSFDNESAIGNSYAGLDNVVLTVVPEPSTMGLAALATGLIGLRRRR